MKMKSPVGKGAHPSAVSANFTIVADPKSCWKGGGGKKQFGGHSFLDLFLREHGKCPKLLDPVPGIPYCAITKLSETDHVCYIVAASVNAAR